MSDRNLLGAADIDDADLADLLGADAIIASTASVLDYDLEAMTTGGRYRVEGTAVRDGAPTDFRLVVKIARSIVHSPVMQHIPDEYKAMAAANLPWQVEPDVYRSGLAAAMPDGLRMPDCLAVRDVDDDSAAIWMESVEVRRGAWTRDRAVAIAHALGRLAASPAVQAVADDIGHVSGPLQARVYLQGRLEAQFVSAYRDGAVFEHPVVARHYDDALRARLLALVDAAPALVEEIEALPLLAAHGDACPNNLLDTADGTVAIDWSFFCRARLGFDLTQLLLSEIELGRSTADDLAGTQAAVLEAHRAGLSHEGVEVDAALLHRAHTLQAAIAIGIPAIPLEQLDLDPATLDPLVRERARTLDHLLTALDL